MLTEIQMQLAMTLHAALNQLPTPFVDLSIIKMMNDSLGQPDTFTEQDCHKAAEWISRNTNAIIAFHRPSLAFYSLPGLTPFTIYQ